MLPVEKALTAAKLCIGKETLCMYECIHCIKKYVYVCNSLILLCQRILANPYLFSAWFLDVFLKLFDYKKEAEEKERKGDNSGVLTTAKDEEGTEWLLYLNLISLY